MTRRIPAIGVRSEHVLTPLYPAWKYPHSVQSLAGAWSPCLTPELGTRLRDFTGRKNHGTLTNMEPATDWVWSEGRRALDYDGVDDHVETNIEPFAGKTHVTVVVWARCSSSAAGLGAVLGDAAIGSNQVLFLENGRSVVWAVGGTRHDVTYGTLFPEGEWTHAVLIRTPSYLRIYRNGVLHGADESSKGPIEQLGTGSTLKIGQVASGSGAGQSFFQGLIDDTRIYFRAWSETEVAEDLSIGRGGWAELEDDELVTTAAAGGRSGDLLLLGVGA